MKSELIRSNKFVFEICKNIQGVPFKLINLKVMGYPFSGYLVKGLPFTNMDTWVLFEHCGEHYRRHNRSHVHGRKYQFC